MVKKPSKAQKAKLRRAGGSADDGESRSGRGGRGGRGRGRGRGGAAAAAGGGGRVGRSSLLPPDQQAAFESRKRTVQLEESAFSKLSPPVLERLNILASYADLRRPIPEELTPFDYSRFGRARAENHQRTLDQEQGKIDERDSHPLAGWLQGGPKQSEKQDRGDDSSDDDEAEKVDEGEDPGVTGVEETGELRLPKRPKWRSDMDTKTIHSQEEEVFRQWLRKTDAVVERAFFTSSPMFAGLTSHTRSDDKAAFAPSPATAGMGGSRMVSSIASQDSISELLHHRPSPGTSVIGSLYERNIEVYRQLWRVCERSDLVCVLADARCPLLHLPPSLIGFLERYMRLKVIIVLTKADIVPKEIVDAWRGYLKQLYPKWEVVATESYAKLERMEGQGSRTRFAPYLSPHSRRELFAALRKAHGDLVTPPKVVQDDAKKSREWMPPCATDTDWEGVERRVQLHTEGFEAGEGADIPERSSENDLDAKDANLPSQKNNQDAKATRSHLPYLTIGLIGQPNVGKSSLLNALFGSKVVRASKTPGKTKHFQTHFLVPLPSPSSSSSNNVDTDHPKAVGEESHRGQIRLCDSPGLVFPSLIGMEMQVMGAILAISQVQAITSCIRFVAEHIALEKVLQLQYPLDEDEAQEEDGKEVWTGVKILEAVARRYMFKTAKANRWDVNRAGNLVMRAVAEGRIKWAFRPPSSREQVGVGGIGEGIWMPEASQDAVQGDESDLLTAPNPDDEEENEQDEKKKTEDEDESDDDADIARKVRFDFGVVETEDDDDDEEDEDDRGMVGSTNSLFSALAVEAGDDDDDDGDDDEDDQEEDQEG
ncbi:nucleolar GTP-binding protein 2 [Pseudozyma hubeiensis SY62]|uniref:Guanine nucleotide-binding protein-like 1 n=1 Tax=Pseudozyma hubeiensis (strain SY62) TaxID=1305764 RepID=R9PD78_PSEHS|nr:nucleolar GTP-binding protein 2 [Pseudozyma hubeiensis SY62]GAC99309.1 nucleolar GTP-binding protein 2 [Pseudozyma hubeiensis SY62]